LTWEIFYENVGVFLFAIVTTWDKVPMAFRILG